MGYLPSTISTCHFISYLVTRLVLRMFLYYYKFPFISHVFPSSMLYSHRAWFILIELDSLYSHRAWLFCPISWVGKSQMACCSHVFLEIFVHPKLQYRQKVYPSYANGKRMKTGLEYRDRLEVIYYYLGMLYLGMLSISNLGMLSIVLVQFRDAIYLFCFTHTKYSLY